MWSRCLLLPELARCSLDNDTFQPNHFQVFNDYTKNIGFFPSLCSENNYCTYVLKNFTKYTLKKV